MRYEHLQYLVCPSCKKALILSRVDEQNGNIIEAGVLACAGCAKTYEISRSIPRFVPQENYAANFGLEWTKHARTQYDSHSGAPVSATRFWAETHWPRRLEGQLMLEVGSGSGRFTEHAISTGAMVISVDLSQAVEVNYAANGHNPNLLIVQASIYDLPFSTHSFDKLFCFGVIQHTPDVKRTFLTLIDYLKPGGSLAIDVYRKWNGLKGLFQTRYWLRSLVKNIQPEKLYDLCVRYVKIMWPVAKLLAAVPYFGRRIIWLFLIPYYDQFGLSDRMLKEWAILDLFDILSARYEYPQTIETVRTWFEEARLNQIEVHYGYNGIEGRGVTPDFPQV